MVDVTAGTVEVGATPTDFGVSVTGEGETRQINVMLPKPEKGDKGNPGDDGGVQVVNHGTAPTAARPPLTPDRKALWVGPALPVNAAVGDSWESNAGHRVKTTSGRWSNTALEVSVKDFGALGDGTTDDSVALKSWISHLATYGGIGVIPQGVYRTTTSVEPPQRAPAGYEIHGERGPDGVPIILVDSDTPVSGISIVQPTGVFIHDIKIMGVSTARPMANGISTSGAKDMVVRNVDIENFSGDGILFTNHATLNTRTNSDNIVEQCRLYGNHIGRNGVNIVGSSDSSIINCDVFDLSTTASPCYGLQLKNSCVRCKVIGGTVVNAKAGVAFGNTGGVEALNTGAHVEGVTVSGCRQGFVGSHTNDSFIKMTINDAGDYADGEAFRFGGNAWGNSAEIVVFNMRGGVVPVVSLGGHRNSVTVDRMNVEPVEGDTFALIEQGVQRSNVLYKGRDAAVQPFVDDQSGRTDNYVKGLM